jgi:FixJ family two-component response regulator
MAVLRKILILEDDPDLTTTYEKIITILGEGIPIIAHSFDELLDKESEVLSTDVALLDVSLGSYHKSGLDAHEWLINHGYNKPVFFVTGHAKSHPLVWQACNEGRAQILTKPITMNALLDIIKGELP